MLGCYLLTEGRTRRRGYNIWNHFISARHSDRAFHNISSILITNFIFLSMYHVSQGFL